MEKLENLTRSISMFASCAQVTKDRQKWMRLKKTLSGPEISPKVLGTERQGRVR